MSLIVNADDFGKSKEVNRAISECFNRGYIDRTTIMVNMPYAYDAVDLAQKNGFIGQVGLHINLTDGTPLSEDIKKNTLFCNDEGQFNQEFCRSTKSRLHMDDESIFDVEKEIEAQLKMYSELGFTLNHIDSHHHVHTDAPIFKALKNLSHVYDFRSIRLSRNLYRGGSILKRAYKQHYNRSVKKICETASDYFGSFSDVLDYFPMKSAEHMNVGSGPDTIITEYLNVYDEIQLKFAEFQKKHDVEIMVHPCYLEDGTLSDDTVPFKIVSNVLK